MIRVPAIHHDPLCADRVQAGHAWTRSGGGIGGRLA